MNALFAVPVRGFVLWATATPLNEAGTGLLRVGGYHYLRTVINLKIGHVSVFRVAAESLGANGPAELAIRWVCL